MMKIASLFLVLVIEGLLGLHKTVHLQLLQNYLVAIGLDFCDIEWFALETNQDQSVVFESTWSFVHHEGYSISSKRFLPTVVDIMFIGIKFTHSSPF